jgi:hypothetical protein
MTLEEVGGPLRIKSWKEGKAKGLGDAYLNRLVDAGIIPAPDPLDMDVSNASLEDKLLGALRICEVYLPAEEKEQFRQLFNPTNIAITVSVVGLWAASHGTPIGYIVDIILLAVSIYMTGRRFASDIDAFDFIDAGTGRRLKPGDEKYELILERLEGGSTQFQHPDHMSWRTIEFSKPLITCKNTTMKFQIILDHTFREPLVDFRADGTVWRRYADPWFTKIPEPPLGMAFGRGDDPF